jgi:DNA-binding MarR family transcriptional regulator
MLDLRFFLRYIVLTMNELSLHPRDELLLYQTRRLKELIEEILQCCQLQTTFLSKKHCIPQAELRCLMLFRGERYLTVKGISQKLDVAKSRVTKIVNGLIQKKLVESAEDPKDARVKLLCLTPAGQVKTEEMGDHIWGNHQKLLLELEPEERRSVISSLDLLRTSMEAVKKQIT